MSHTVTAFKTNGELKSSTQKIPASVAIIRGMFISDDFLFLYKQKDTTLFDIFKLPNCQYINSSGYKGNGPSDFIFLDPRSFTAKKDGFSVLEAGSHILKTVKMQDQELIVSNTEKMFEESEATNGFYTLSENKYLSFGNINNDKEFIIFDNNNKTSMEVGDYPSWAKTNVDQPYQKFITYIKNCVVHPNGSMFAAFYGRFKRFRIYNGSGMLLHDVNVMIEPFSTDIEKEYEKQWTYYIGSPQVINNYIYTICINQKGNDRKNCELQIWDWEGKPIACYNLDKQVSYFSISYKYNKLFTYDVNTDDEIYIYELPIVK